MTSQNGSGLGNKTIIVLISLLASCITLFSFATGILSIPEILERVAQGATRANQESSTVDEVITIIPPSQPTRDVPATVQTNTASPTISLPEVTALPSELLGLEGYHVSRLAVATDGNIYAGTLGSQGMFKSTNDGSSWQAINNGLGGLDIIDLDVVIDDPQTVFAVTQGKGLWVTRDGGQNWYALHQDHGLNNLAFLTNDGNRVISSDTWGMPRLSNDRGASWSEVSRDSTEDWTVLNGGTDLILNTQSDPSTIYVRVRTIFDGAFYKTQDGGRSWLPVARIRPNYRGTWAHFSISPLSSNLTYACTHDIGVYRSQDGMGSWEPINNSLPNQGVELECSSSLASKFETDTVYVYLKGYGLYKSQDRGSTWRMISSVDLDVTTMTESPEGHVLLGSTNGIYSISVANPYDFLGVTPTPSDTSGGTIYIVSTGDTMNSISTEFGVPVSRIMEANGIDDANLLSVGQQLLIPDDE